MVFEDGVPGWMDGWTAGHSIATARSDVGAIDPSEVVACVTLILIALSLLTSIIQIHLCL